VPGDGKPVLSQYSFSSFNEKARWALDYKRVPHVRRSLLPGELRALWLSRGDGIIPVLDLDGERIVDTTRSIEALDRRYPQPPLYPKDPGERRRALELEDFFDEEAGHELRRAVFYEQLDNREHIATLLGTAPAAPGATVCARHPRRSSSRSPGHPSSSTTIPSHRPRGCSTR